MNRRETVLTSKDGYLVEKLESDDVPHSMRDVGVRKRRRAMLMQPHVAPLTAYAAKLRQQGAGEVPDFDPLDGGVDAEILFLFEKPGPMTSDGKGSGFISRNNDDPTAETTFKFMEQAGISRKLTVTWNLIPWWNGKRKVTTHEVRKGLACLGDLVRLLPRLRAVVLVGNHAAKAKEHLETAYPRLTVLTSAHPSPLVRASNREVWESIPREWAKARDVRFSQE